MRPYPLLAALLLFSACNKDADTGTPVDDDVDDDGVLADVDCDDTNGTVGGPTSWYVDADGDGFGAGDLQEACLPASGAADVDGDCDDADPAFHPGAVEDDCEDPNDYDCDGAVDFADADGDGSAACVDCDDADESVAPGAVELCNTVDDDCDGEIDEDDAADATTWHADADGDGWGDAASSLVSCDALDGYVSDGTDCDDTSGAVSPGATEICDAADVDEDCDGAADDLDAGVSAESRSTWYADADGDGYGADGVTTDACETPEGHVAAAGDCDDDDATVNPGGAEVCDALDIDEDCDGSADDDDSSATGTSTVYADGDGDGYGDPAASLGVCDDVRGYVADATDCEPDDDTSYPGGSEVCDGADNDCDGSVDEGLDCFDYAEFDNCGATGASGPDQASCDSSYSGTSIDGQVTVTAGLQQWTIPADGDYLIEAWGAIGASADVDYLGGEGAYASGVFTLAKGEVLTILVGQRGLGQSSVSNGGGGGGTFVVDSSNTPLVVAGGGGGTREDVLQDGCDGRDDAYGGVGSGGSTTVTCAASSDPLGGGGSVSSSSWGSGGGGFNSDGGADGSYGYGGSAFLAGGGGGTINSAGGFVADGGFGGGGSGNGYYGGGGGGGYTGGQGGRVAGGGGSYVDSAAASPTLVAGASSGDGAVLIEQQ